MTEEENAKACKHLGPKGECSNPRVTNTLCWTVDADDLSSSCDESSPLPEVETPEPALADILKALLTALKSDRGAETTGSLSVVLDTPLGKLEVHVHECWEEDESVTTTPPWLVLTLHRLDLHGTQDDFIIWDLVPKTDIEFYTPTTQADLHEAVRRNLQFDETTLATYLPPTGQDEHGWATSLFQPVSDNLAAEPALLVRSRHLTPRERVVLAAVHECETHSVQTDHTLGYSVTTLLRTNTLTQAREWDGKQQVVVALGQLVSLGLLTTAFGFYRRTRP